MLYVSIPRAVIATYNIPRITVNKTCIYPISTSIVPALNFLTIEDNFGYVRIKGELSGINNHSSGHIYLTLKDENAVINGIIWRSSVAKIKIRPEEGLEVICTGKISTGYNPGRYAGRSNYQITIDTMKPAGTGTLMAILEERKEKLKSRLTTEEKANHEKFIKELGNTSMWSKILKS